MRLSDQRLPIAMEFPGRPRKSLLLIVNPRAAEVEAV